MKDRETILNQSYISVSDLQILTGLGKNKCTEIMNDLKEEMKKDGKFIPLKKKILIPTKLVRKKLSI